MLAGLNRRAFLGGIAGSTLVALPARAQEPYPSRPVEVVVPFSAGGSTDVIARMLCDGLTRRLGKPFLAVNRPGANTNLGTATVAKARPDGYSLLMASLGLAANPSLYRKLPFDPATDLTPISLIANAASMLVVHPSVPAKTVAEVVSYIKERPGQLDYASYGVGSTPHLAAAIFQSLTGTQMVQISYKGGGDAAAALLSHQVHMMFVGPQPVLSMVQSGMLRAIAVASDRRLAILPDVPTFIEGGVDFRSGTWFGLLAPAGTPDDIVGRIHAATAETFAEPDVRTKLLEQGVDVVANSPAEFARFLAQETDRLSAVVRSQNLRMD
jgi:tripartite-type tricarboxylate transporter receptor subunit TctC